MNYGSFFQPSFRGASTDEEWQAALDMPLSAASTFWESTKAGVLESFGAGTAIREFSLPDEAPTKPEMMLEPAEGGEPVLVPDTPQMRRRMAVAPESTLRPETDVELGARREKVGALDQDAYKNSPYFREDIPWDAGMTEERAAALATMYDVKKVREYYGQKRPITAFLGNLAGQAIDPINYIPIAGPAVRAANTSRFGRIAGEAATASLDAALNTGIFGLATRDTRQSFGDDVSWQTTVSEIATAALIGGAFGSLSGALGKRADAKMKAELDTRLATIKNAQEARIALNEAIGGLVNDGDVRLSPNATAPLARVASEVQAALPTFRTEVRGDSHGQTDMTLRMVSGGEELGRIDFAEFEGRPSIQMIEVPEAQRRKGFASEMLRELQRAYPDQEIDWGSLTPDGAKLREATVFKEVPSEAAPIFKQLEDAQAALKALEEERAAKWEEGKPLDQQSPEVQEMFTREVDAADIVSDIEYQMRLMGDVSPTKKLIELPDRNVAPAAIDTSVGRQDPIPEGRQQAEATIAKPDDYKALAAQYRVDPESGAYLEEGEVRQLQDEGRLSAEDIGELDAGQQTFENGVSWGEALKAAVNCLI